MLEYVFPARAGMSPGRYCCRWCRRCVPRASGDEPGDLEEVAKAFACSPRERG